MVDLQKEARERHSADWGVLQHAGLPGLAVGMFPQLQDQ